MLTCQQKLTGLAEYLWVNWPKEIDEYVLEHIFFTSDDAIGLAQNILDKYAKLIRENNV